MENNKKSMLEKFARIEAMYKKETSELINSNKYTLDYMKEQANNSIKGAEKEIEEKKFELKLYQWTLQEIEKNIKNKN